MQEEEINREKLHAAEVFHPPDRAPPGMKFQRNNIDFVNNFFVNIVALSFTNIPEMQENHKEDHDN